LENQLTQLRKGVLEYCVLAQLESEPRYGFELAKRLTKYPTVLESEGTLYPLLARLRKSGRVTTVWAESPNGPPRRYYELTEEGHSALNAFRDAWSEFSADTTAALKEEK